ncbi:MAG TPA: LEA type 2 family protein [Bacteroidia bacterium]|nr:LEA type 2 family protein [Bacteroidia bacterium]
MKKTLLFFLLASCVFFTSCGLKPVVPNKITDVKFGKIDIFKGTVVMDMGLQIDNPNKFAITVHGLELDVKVANVSLGTVTVEDKIKIAKDTQQVYRVNVNAKLVDVINGIPALLAAIGQQETNAEVNGWIKVGVFGIRKKFPVAIKQEQVATSDEKKQ